MSANACCTDAVGKSGILHLISSSSFLGAERVLCELAGKLDSSRFELTVGLLGSPPSVVEAFRGALEGAGVAVEHFPSRRKFSPLIALRIARLVRKRRVSLVHSHGYKSDFYSQLARLLGGRGVAVATNHNWITGSLAEKLYRLLDIRILKRFSKVVAVSEKLEQEMASLGIARQRLTTIVNGISLAEPCAGAVCSLRAAHSIPEQALVVGCVAALIPVKAHGDLLRAFALLVKEYPSSVLMLVGDGAERAGLESVAQELGLGGQVRFLGYRADVRELYALFDIFALVSYSEGIPMALLEAMSWSLPVVATSVGGMPQVVNPGVNGLLVPSGEPAAIAGALAELAASPSRRSELGAQGRAEVLARFSVARMAREYEKLYLDVLGEKS